MKTIEEKAMELYPHYSGDKSISQTDEWTGNEIQKIKRDYYIHGYKEGKAEANAEWQEKVRWIPMQEGTYPEVRDKSYRILVKGEVEFMSTEIILSDYTHYDFENLRMFYTHWREIIE